MTETSIGIKVIDHGHFFAFDLSHSISGQALLPLQ
jgi:hypothetical protein